MTSLLDWAHTYAKLIGVLAAVIIFGSWIVENIVVRRLKDLRDVIVRVREDKDATASVFRVESKLLEVYQVAASARRYAAEARSAERWTFKDELYSDVELLERVGVTQEFADAILAYPGRAEGAISAISPPSEIADRVRRGIDVLNTLHSELTERRAQYFERQRELVGEVIDPNSITEEQARRLGEVIREYRNDVEFGLAPRLAPAANELFRAYDALFGYARSELARRERRTSLITRLQIGLFVFGSVIALASTYLEATMPANP